MKRVFGKKKEKVPAPSLNDAGGRVDERVAKIDEKVSIDSSDLPCCVNLELHAVQEPLGLLESLRGRATVLYCAGFPRILTQGKRHTVFCRTNCSLL